MGVVKILLERDELTPDKPNSKGEALLCWAARNGHEGVFRYREKISYLCF